MYPDNLKPFKGGGEEMVGFCIILSKGLDRMEKEKVSFSLQWLVSFCLWLCSLCRSTNQHTNTLCFRHLLCGPCLLTPYVLTRTWVRVPAWHARAVFAGYKDLQHHSFKYEGFSLHFFFFLCQTCHPLTLLVFNKTMPSSFPSLAWDFHRNIIAKCLTSPMLNKFR